jgi:Ran GTPase-activating protein (RanGAP) involved in mRNA processing and transport
VTSLDLPDNDITDTGARILSQALMKNHSLTQLQLAANKIGDEGATSVAQVLLEEGDIISMFKSVLLLPFS